MPRRLRLNLRPARLLRMLFLVLAAALGPVYPRFVRHEDATCQIEEAPDSSKER